MVSQSLAQVLLKFYVFKLSINLFFNNLSVQTTDRDYSKKADVAVDGGDASV